MLNYSGTQRQPSSDVSASTVTVTVSNTGVITVRAALADYDGELLARRATRVADV